ncbi:MAG: class I SAM-dependent methyltransferase [Candidatus Thermoplasmatota archaeon]|nr:class I SAM-dependent methyltransferase [Candidatus Thermoplasmatota archaeon]
MKMKDDRTIKAYDVYSDVYDAETSDFWDGFPEDIVQDFTRNLNGNRVIDLGSGPGRDAIILRDAGLEVLCVDASEKMAEQTRKKGFTTIISDIRDLNIDLSDYEGVWAYSSLIHISFEESRKLLMKLSENMKNGTIMLLGVIRGERNEERKLGDSNYIRYFEMFTENKIGALLDGTHFEIMEMKTYQPKNHVYMNYILKLNK